MEIEHHEIHRMLQELIESRMDFVTYAIKVETGADMVEYNKSRRTETLGEFKRSLLFLEIILRIPSVDIETCMREVMGTDTRYRHANKFATELMSRLIPDKESAQEESAKEATAVAIQTIGTMEG